MTTFFVGQRVRIKWSTHAPELNGAEGVVVGPADDNHSFIDGSIDDATNVYVAPDVWGTHVNPATGTWFAPASCQLEPLSDSNNLVSWESMRDLWVPDHLRVAA